MRLWLQRFPGGSLTPAQSPGPAGRPPGRTAPPAGQFLGLGSSVSLDLCDVVHIYCWSFPPLNLHVLWAQNEMKNFRETKQAEWQRTDQILKESRHLMEDNESHLTDTCRSMTRDRLHVPDPIGNQRPSQMSKLQDRAESRMGVVVQAKACMGTHRVAGASRD